MPDHPYRNQPPRAFWSRSVADGYDSADVYTGPRPLLRHDDRLMSAGSCFASNLVPFLEREGFTYLRTEQPHPLVAHLEEHLGYRNFTAAYGNIYTARQFLQLIDRATGCFTPAEDRWHVGGAVIDPFRPGLAYAATNDGEFDALTAQHLAAVLKGIEEATVLVFTLGLTEAWRSTIDGAVYPGCPGTIAGDFDSARHEFHNFSVAEVADDLAQIRDRLSAINPELRTILTVSPVPLVATATDGHVLAATVYSKSVLRAAAGQAAQHPGVEYFPAYEIVTGPQAPDMFFEADRRNVSAVAVGVVMGALLAACETGGQRRPTTAVTHEAAALSQRIAEAECDEMMADPLTA